MLLILIFQLSVYSSLNRVKICILPDQPANSSLYLRPGDPPADIMVIASNADTFSIMIRKSARAIRKADAPPADPILAL